MMSSKPHSPAFICYFAILLLQIIQSTEGYAIKRSADLDFLCKRQSGLAFCRGHEPRKQENFEPTKSRAMAARQRDYVEKPASPFEKNSVVDEASPFDTIATRPPISRAEHEKAIEQTAIQQHQKQQNGYYRPAVGGAMYNIYPILYPKGADYCPQMKGMFAFTCQPSKPLRVDLVKFCQEYSEYCKVVNTHRLPGPGLGPPRDPSKGTGHVDINGHFGFGLGALPGFEVNAGWGVDVGPIPGMGDSVGVGVGADLGILGASAPEKYRRGYDNPKDKKGGIFGISGGVGVDAPGAGPIGVGSGIGVGR